MHRPINKDTQEQIRQRTRIPGTYALGCGVGREFSVFEEHLTHSCWRLGLFKVCQGDCVTGQGITE